MIELTCDCGHNLRSNNPPWGKSLLCPACGRQVPVPPREEGVTAERSPAGTDRGDDEAPRRRRGVRDDDAEYAVGRGSTSGKAITSFVLGIAGCFLSCVAGLPAVILGFMALGEISNSRGAIRGKWLAYTGITFGIVSMVLSLVALPFALLLPAIQKIRGAAERMQSQNNMKQLTLAMHGYNDANGRLPLAYAPVQGAPGQQGMSWRVALLPYIEQEPLYHQYRENEAWDGPTNRSLQSVQVTTFQFPQDTKTPPNQTYYQVFVTAPGKAPHAMFTHPTEAKNRVSFSNVEDGLYNTILIAEAPTAVVWTSPGDMPFDPDQMPPPLGSHFSAGSLVGMADGSTRFIPKTVAPATLKALITRDGNEVITDPDW